ncbi:MAG: hypothetical protein CMN30_13950 [Sandaracinus sp.]|nr:hypothetical protein [Sandaracinus sp.]
MSIEAAGGAASGAAGNLTPGTVVGGRFRVERKAREDELGSVFKARDEKTQKAIALRRVEPGLLDAGGVQKLRAECRTAATLSHRNLAVTYGVGTASGSPFIASEWVDGKPMSVVVRERAAKGGHVSLKGAYNVVASVCRALEAVHEKTCHGALRPSVVWVTESGRVKLADLGLGKALVEARGPEVFDARDQASLAPEVKGGQPPTTAADVFGVGALLYELLTAKSPADGFVPPSQVHPEADGAVDEILLKCLAPDPGGRFESADAVRSALQPLVDGTDAASAADDFGFDVDIDLDGDGDVDVPAPAVAAPARPAAPAPRPHQDLFPSPAAPLSAPAGDEVDLGQLLAKITENDAARWMAVKDGLDHGPFTGRELVQLIVDGEIREEHDLMNMDTGERRPVAEWPDFTEFVEQWKIRDAQAAKKAALAHAEKSEARSGAFKLAVAAGALLAILAGIGIFVATREGGEAEVVAEAETGDLYERGGIELTGTAGILPDPPRSARGGRRRSGMGGGGGGFAGSYEDAMNQAVELGDVNSAGGQSRLSPAQVQGVMNRHLNGSVGRCADRESGLGNVTIDIAIAGSGQVMGVSARQGSEGFKSCIRSAVRGIRFPSFGAPRMGARFSFNAS